MDSKLKRTAITVAVLVVMLVVLLVWGLNREQKTGSKGAAPGKPSVQTNPGNAADKEAGQAGTDLKAFLNDEDFFDKEELSGDAIQTEMPKLSLWAFSVERDIRLQIVDSTGESVTGVPFLVKLGSGEEYRDSDRDGRITINNLEPGAYSLQLLPVEGYVILTESLGVQVKDKLEYVAIEDISCLVRNEDEIDGKEDTRNPQAAADRDSSESARFPESPEGKKIGVDVSSKQGEIHWSDVKSAGVDFGIVRVGYRGSNTGELIRDPNFERNWKEMMAAGMPGGISFFSQAINEREAVEEASMVLEEIRLLDKPDYPIFFMLDNAGADARAAYLSVEERTQICKAFCDTVEGAGYTAGIYAPRLWIKHYLTAEELSSYVIWIADYRNEPLYDGYYQMWQFTDGAAVEGIKGKTTLNIFTE